MRRFSRSWRSARPPFAATNRPPTGAVPTMHNPWIAYYQPRPAARLRLFCFHHAGGGPGVFRTWPDDLPAEVEVCPVLLPGREARRGEPCETNLDRLADHLVQA